MGLCTAMDVLREVVTEEYSGLRVGGGCDGLKAARKDTEGRWGGERPGWAADGRRRWRKAVVEFIGLGFEI